MPFAIFSTSSSAERARPPLGRIAAVAWLCAAPLAVVAAEGSRVAVFPPVSLTDATVPLDQVQATLESSLSAHGFSPLPQAELEEFLRRHLIRYMGGIPADIARAIGEETGVDGILLTSVDDWETVDPPRVAVTSRWVAAKPEAPLVWMETSAQHGQEHPGAFGLGLVTSVEVLLARASDEIAGSLAELSRTIEPAPRSTVARRFRPGSFAVDRDWADAAVTSRPPRVAVLPFVADTARREVGEVLALQVVRCLLEGGDMQVLEPGVVRDALLEARVIQEDGPSLPQVDALHALLDVDLVVSGRVTDYEAMGSAPGTPFLGFSTRGIDARTRQAVWSSFSFGRGDDRPGPFGTGRVHSSITLTSELVRGVVEALAEELGTQRSRERAAGKKESSP
jgi:hypothetical protein